MAKPNATTSKEDEADYAWLMGVFSRIPNSVYGRSKNSSKTNGEVALSTVPKKSIEKNKKTGKNNKNSKKLTDMPEKMAELQQRLREKIAGLREERKADDAEMIARRESRKRSRDEKQGKGAIAKRRKETQKEGKEQAADVVESSPDQSKDVSPEPQNVIEVSRLEGFETVDNEGGSKSKKRPRTKGTKLNELEKQLGDALEMREQTNTVVDVEVLKQKEVEKALLRAKGIAVRDDVTKLRKTIRKEKRKTEKSKEEWSKRVNALEEEKMAKQKKREENLRERRENKGKAKSKVTNSKGKRKK